MPTKTVRDSGSSSIFYADCWGTDRRRLPATLTLTGWRRYDVDRRAGAALQSLNLKTTPIVPSHRDVNKGCGRFKVLVFDLARFRTLI
jgi:hypothetical protein